MQSCSPAFLCSVGPRLCPSAAAIAFIAAAGVSAIITLCLYWPWPWLSFATTLFYKLETRLARAHVRLACWPDQASSSVNRGLVDKQTFYPVVGNLPYWSRQSNFCTAVTSINFTGQCLFINNLTLPVTPQESNFCTAVTSINFTGFCLALLPPNFI